jgi:dihydrolipoamide dehydrogenase
VLDGHGRLGPDRTVTVSGGSSGEVELTADAVVLAPGSVPRTIPGFDVDGRIVMTSDEVLSMPEVPKRAAIIGGGVIGCEFASMMADLGTEVTILEALPKILVGLDGDVTKVIERSFTKRGMTIRTGVKVEGHEPGDAGTTVALEGGDTVEADVVVVSVGGAPTPTTCWLDGTGVSLSDAGFIEVDEGCRTGAEAVWAVGDAIATPPWPTSASPRGCWSSGTSWARTRRPSTTARSRGASTPARRPRSPATRRSRPRRPASRW